METEALIIRVFVSSRSKHRGCRFALLLLARIMTAFCNVAHFLERTGPGPGHVSTHDVIFPWIPLTGLFKQKTTTKQERGNERLEEGLPYRCSEESEEPAYPNWRFGSNRRHLESLRACFRSAGCYRFCKGINQLNRNEKQSSFCSLFLWKPFSLQQGNIRTGSAARTSELSAILSLLLLCQ